MEDAPGVANPKKWGRGRPGACKSSILGTGEAALARERRPHGLIEWCPMAQKTQAKPPKGSASSPPRSRTRTVLLVTGIALGIAAFIVVLIVVNHTVDQNACRRFATQVGVAMGDGVSSPAPSTAGLDPSTAKAVSNSRLNYQKQLAKIPSLPVAEQAQRRAVLEELWVKYVGRTEAYLRQSHGC